MSQCSVPGCERAAEFEVIIYDVYPAMLEVFFERDSTCPSLCGKHMVENENGARGERRPRGSVSYPFTNGHGAQGFSIYKPLTGG